MEVGRDNLDPSISPEAVRAAVEDQGQTLEELRTEVALLREQNRRLEHLLRELRRALYGRRSEKLSAEERQLAFEDLEGAVSEAEESPVPSLPSPSPKVAAKLPPPSRNLGNLPQSLPRVERVIEPGSTKCPCGCGRWYGSARSAPNGSTSCRRSFASWSPSDPSTRAGCASRGSPWPRHRRISSKGAFPPRARSPRYWCPSTPTIVRCTGNRRSTPARVLELHRSTLADWVGKASFHLRPVADRLAEHLKRSTKLFLDETRAPVLDPGRGRTKTGYLWALARDDRGWSGPDPPAVVYLYAPGRGGQHAERFLRGFTGILQVDAYAGYHRLTTRASDPLTLALCWAHARRKLREVFDHDHSPVAAEGLRRIAELYAIEADIRGASPERRLAERQSRTAPLVEAFSSVAAPTALARVGKIATGPEARLHRPALRRPSRIPRRQPRRDGLQRGGEFHPGVGSESKERVVRRSR